MKLIVSYGFDGSTGQSLYQQNFKSSARNSLDQSLFVTTLLPLKLEDSTGQVVWMSRSPQSPRFCRSLEIEFIKESNAHILKQNAKLDFEIKNVLPFVYENEKMIVRTHRINTTVPAIRKEYQAVRKKPRFHCCDHVPPHNTF